MFGLHCVCSPQAAQAANEPSKGPIGCWPQKGGVAHGARGSGAGQEWYIRMRCTHVGGVSTGGERQVGEVVWSPLHKTDTEK